MSTNFEPLTAAQFSAVRPWRNLNPGDLRTLAGEEKWDGQIGVDFAAGGPFVQFSTAIMGWRALAKLLINYYNFYGLCTIEDITHRFAPGSDNNNESAYATTVAAVSGLAVDQRLNLGDFGTVDKLCMGVSIAEGGARLPWDVSERIAGLRLAMSGAP